MSQYTLHCVLDAVDSIFDNFRLYLCHDKSVRQFGISKDNVVQKKSSMEGFIAVVEEFL